MMVPPIERVRDSCVRVAENEAGERANLTSDAIV